MCSRFLLLQALRCCLYETLEKPLPNEARWAFGDCTGDKALNVTLQKQVIDYSGPDTTGCRARTCSRIILSGCYSLCDILCPQPSHFCCRYKRYLLYRHHFYALQQGSYRSWKTWKVMEFDNIPGLESHGIFVQVMENHGI